MVVIYRSTTGDETLIIEETKEYSPSPNGCEIKYFTSTHENASLYGKMAFMQFQSDPPYTNSSGSIHHSFIESEGFVDMGIPTIIVNKKNIDKVINVDLTNYMDI
ncbi:hypothetical protein [Acetobacter senegalensis]|uniref:hypothetical protein n=1 Tax=Acetobacter senegalensis TaxID=446692 RepID=UPI00128B8D0A|nr:hypothetical protein [Acetobacter senegalensis]MPQ74555.1 hypothetical protein [Acetobacter senegalensis]